MFMILEIATLPLEIRVCLKNKSLQEIESKLYL